MVVVESMVRSSYYFGCYLKVKAVVPMRRAVVFGASLLSSVMSLPTISTQGYSSSEKTTGLRARFERRLLVFGDTVVTEVLLVVVSTVSPCLASGQAGFDDCCALASTCWSAASLLKPDCRYFFYCTEDGMQGNDAAISAGNSSSLVSSLECSCWSSNSRVRYNSIVDGCKLQDFDVKDAVS